MYVVFDLDGTLFDVSHREHHVREHPKDWDAFYDACPDDEPCHVVLETLRAHVLAGHCVEIWTGRSDRVRDQTIAQLRALRVQAKLARMRPAADHRPDVELKREWLLAMDEGDRPDLVYEDRRRVVDMWRANGIVCAQVAPGEF